MNTGLLCVAGCGGGRRYILECDEVGLGALGCLAVHSGSRHGGEVSERALQKVNMGGSIYPTR